jgi:K+-sensing histidine kinase KdpD
MPGGSKASASSSASPIRGDSELLREALGAVLENACECIAGAGTVTLVARSATLTEADCLGLFGNPGPGPCVEVAVSDTGCGLSLEVQRHLLAEPFFSSKPGHRGLGLAIVHGILHVHRGGFRLDPGPERGAVVRLFLPLAGGQKERPPTGARQSANLNVLATCNPGPRTPPTHLLPGETCGEPSHWSVPDRPDPGAAQRRGG